MRKYKDIEQSILENYAGYIAGLFDGEGSFIIRCNKRTRCPNFYALLSIGMTHKGVILWLRRVLGVTGFSVSRKGRKRIYVLRVTTRDETITIIEELLPWLRVKKEQAKNLLKMLTLKETGNKKELVMKKAELYLRNKELNKRREFDIDKERNILNQRINDYFR